MLPPPLPARGDQSQYNCGVTRARDRSSLILVGLVVVSVGVAFADSSIVVLALPELYTRFHATIEGVSWVVTAYNAAVAVVALALVVFVHRLRPVTVLTVGLLAFTAASLACSLAGSLWFLVAARSLQGMGAALLLAGALPVLASLTGSPVRGTTLWTLAGTFGAVLGPALGGVVTQAFGWRAIFAVQAPLAAMGVFSVVAVRAAPVFEEGWKPALTRSVPANIAIGLVFGALVGVLFLSVLLVITVWGYSPLAGAGIVSVLPAATVAARPLGRRLPGSAAVYGGVALLAIGLLELALLPSASVGFTVGALIFCGVGLGLCIPVLSQAALDVGTGLSRSGTLTIGVRHLGLVLALACIAPLLASELPPAGHRAELRSTAVLLDAPIGLSSKIPIALDARAEFARAKAGEIPDLAKPFDVHGAKDDRTLAAVRDRLVSAIKDTITRAFRSSFLLSASLAVAALVMVLLFRRRGIVG
jgi:predicted MFS family arabinose efflux permease